MKDASPISTKAEQPLLTDYEKADRVAFFEMFYSAFQEALANEVGAKDFYYHLAGQTIRLRFAGDALVPYLTRALAHLFVTPTENPDFTFCVWESLTTGRPLPRLLADFNRHITHLPWLGIRGISNEVFPYSDERIQTSLHGEKDILTVSDRERKICVYWTQDASELRYYEIGGPLRMALQWQFNTPNRQMIHGGAVGTEQLGGVLLLGKSGSGKSTTALSCLDSDLSYAGDDYILIDIEPEVTAHSVFQTAKVKTFQDLERFPHLKSWIMNANRVAKTGEKPMMFIGEHQPEKIIKRLPIKAIVFPRFVAGADYRLEPLSQSSAFKEIITSTIKQTPFGDKESLQMVTKLVRSVPTYLLVFGGNQSRLPDIIKQILAENQ
jgi:hypothetical protein